MNDWLIADAANLAWRCFYSRGERDPKLSIALLARDVELLSSGFDCPNVAWAFDCPPYRRKDDLPSYKSKRRDSEDEATIEFAKLIAHLRDELLPWMGCENVLTVPGFEADDAIAAAVRNHPDDGARFVIASGDKDLYQLLDKRTAVYHPIPKQFVTAKSFKAEHAIPARRWHEVKALAGCSSDCVPGAHRVGEKTAIKYLLGSLNRLGPSYNTLRNFDGSADHARNLRLVTLPHPDCPPVELREATRLQRSWRELARALDLKWVESAVEQQPFGAVLNAQ